MRQLLKAHHPVDDPVDRTRLLRERFGELGPVALQFLDGLLAKQVQGKLQAQQLLALVAQYQRDDVRAAFERAVRFGAFSSAAVRRILAATAKPKQWPDELVDLQDRLSPSLREDPIGSATGQRLSAITSPSPEEPSHETPVPRRKLRRTTIRSRPAQACVTRSSPTSPTLRVPVIGRPGLDAALTDAEQNGRSHLEPTAPPAHRSGRPAPPSRRIERLIKDANFREAAPSPEHTF